MPRPAFPISLYLVDRRVVVVSGDEVASERLSRLRDAGAEIVELAADSSDETVKHALVGAAALLAHTGDRDRNRQLARLAQSAQTLAYAHDQPDESDFAMPALVRRGRVKIAISTDGTAPALARRLRELLERAVDSDSFDALIDELVELRASLPRDQRHRLYEVARRLQLTGSFDVEE